MANKNTNKHAGSVGMSMDVVGTENPISCQLCTVFAYVIEHSWTSSEKEMVPPHGLEPRTYGLQIRCSTS